MAAEKGSTKEPEKTGMQAFAEFLWNPETKTVLGRTGISWLKITVFYIIFYICLAAFFSLMLAIFYSTIDLNYPKWQLDASRIGTNPGLGYRPRPPNSRIDSSLINFKPGENGDWQHWVENLEEFLKPYTQDSNDTIGRGQYVASPAECEGDKQPPPDKFCPFDIKSSLRGECNAANSFGYKIGKPCVLIKLNRIYNWIPQPLTEKPQGPLINDDLKGGVAIECHGEAPADIERLGEIKYYPNQIIKKSFFPFTNQPGYLSPFVMVQFVSPNRGALINVECRAWAANVKYDRAEREGSVHFELLLE